MKLRIKSVMKNKVFLSILHFVCFFCFFAEVARSDEMTYHDFSKYSMEEMGIPIWGIGKREDQYKTDSKVFYEGIIFEALLKRFNLYAHHPRALLNLDEMSLHNGTLSFQNCYNRICSHFNKPDKLKL